VNDKYQLQISMRSECKKAIREKLLAIVAELDSEYGKPCQGRMIQYMLETQVITPIWNGKPY
jgi:hypothetical protein